MGEIDARFVQGRLALHTDDGVSYVESFTLVVDAPEREETGSTSVAASNGSIVFSASFHAAPNVWGVASNAANRVAFSPGLKRLV